MRGYHQPSSVITLRNALMAGGKCCVFVWFCFCCLVWFKLPCRPVSPLVQKENTLWTVPSNMLGPINFLGQWTETDAQRVPPANGDELLYCAVLVQCDPGWPDMVLSNLTHICISIKLISDHITAGARKVLLNVGILQRLTFIPGWQWWHWSSAQP